MNLEDLEEAMEEILPAGFSIETNSKGEIVIYTNMKRDDDGELISMDDYEEDADSDFERLEDEDELEDDE